MAGSRLFKPLTIGNMKLNHRMGMAPLTRLRSSEEHVPLLDLMVEYYGQRASVPGTMLITEATFISKKDVGTPFVPGIWNQDQVDAWKKITDAVHAKGSYLVCQLWAPGRAADPNIAKAEGVEVVSSDATPMEKDGPTPKRLSVEEIQEKVKTYATAAKNAIAAGFDAVEIHGANGYLIDQFTQDVCNHRDDRYGGSIENRSRFAVEVVDAVVAAVGSEKVGIRLSPWSKYQGMRMENPIPQFTDVVTKLAKFNLAYIHLIESRVSGTEDVEATDKLTFIYDIWKGPVLVGGGYKADSARRLVDEELPQKDVVVIFGRYFISTPDLPFRIKNNLELADYNRATFYAAKSATGYTDYPFSQEFLKQKA